MNVFTREVRDVTILEIQGMMTLGEGTASFRSEIRNLLKDGHGKIVVNLAGLTYVDASGIGELVSAHTHCTSRKGWLVLLNVSKSLRGILANTKLDTIFAIYDDEQAALESLKK